jgi:tRNA nucleotidyltransferase (CCA-adding enzyme)
MKEKPMKYIANHEKLFVVGGYCRDLIMGIEPHDVDYCFAGTAEELLALFPYAKLVGDSFPVYLVDGCEVALTRTEASTGEGYGDFAVTAVGVSIEEDLNRRDVTMNQIAINTLTHKVIDPTDGVSDINAGIIRTTNVNVFVEDPVRILRIIRFAATMNFVIELNTLSLMGESINRLNYVTRERIFKELEKMYIGAVKPSIFFSVLKHIDGLNCISPVLELMTTIPAGPVKYHKENTIYDHTMEVIDRVKANGGSFSAFVAALVHDFGKVLSPINEDKSKQQHIGHEYAGLELIKEFIAANRFDAYTNELMLVASKNHMKAHKLFEMKPIKLVRFVKSVPKHMVADFHEVTAADHPTIEHTEQFTKVFCFVNSYRLTEDEIKRVFYATNKKQMVENILSKHLAEYLKH